MIRSLYYELTFEDDADQAGELRRPLANLQNIGKKSNRIRSRQQKENSEAFIDKENVEKSSIKCENADPIFQTEHKKGLERQETTRFRKAIQSDFTDADVNLNPNPALLKDIYFNMKVAESKICPLFRTADKISSKLRSSIIDWIVYTTEFFEFDTETLHLAVHYFDKYLSKEEAGVDELLKIGTCAILLACKLAEARNDFPEMDDFVKHASFAFFKHEIKKMERKMLKVLDFQMSYPTAYQFLQIFCEMFNVKGEETFLAQYLCDIALFHEEICFCTEPSRIAAASLALANYLLDIPSRFNDIVFLSGYGDSDLKVIATLLFAKFDEILATEFKAVIAKYSSPKYKNVSGKNYARALNI